MVLEGIWSPEDESALERAEADGTTEAFWDEWNSPEQQAKREAAGNEAFESDWEDWEQSEQARTALIGLAVVGGIALVGSGVAWLRKRWRKRKKGSNP